MLLIRRTQEEVEPLRRTLAWPQLFAGLSEEPALKVEELLDGGILVIRAELPGVDPDKDVQVTVADQALTIHAERRHETKAEDPQGFRSEFHYGALTRTVALPPGVTADDVKATYADGILEVRLPVAQQEAVHTVAITRT